MPLPLEVSSEALNEIREIREKAIGIDTTYLDKLIGAFFVNRGKIVEIKNISAYPDKFIYHVKYYRTIQSGDFPIVELDSNYTKIKIT